MKELKKKLFYSIVSFIAVSILLAVGIYAINRTTRQLSAEMPTEIVYVKE